MDYTLAEKILSPARLNPYLKASKGVHAAALKLYMDNARLAQAFYSPLALLEVALRNALKAVLSNHFSDSNWLIKEQQGFMIDPSLPTYFNHKTGKNEQKDFLQKQVKEAVKSLSKGVKNHLISGERIIAELTFGFWTAFYEKDYYRLLHGKPLDAFLFIPKTENRDSINGKLFELRQFRNRVYHYEPLCFQRTPNRPLCLSQIMHKHKLICDLLTWIEPELANWSAESDCLPALIAEMKAHYPHSL